MGKVVHFSIMKYYWPIFLGYNYQAGCCYAMPMFLYNNCHISLFTIKENFIPLIRTIV